MTEKKKKKRVYKDRTGLMTQSERHMISENHPLYDECARVCHLSKNLANATIYAQRQSFFAGSFLNYYAVNKDFTASDNVDYRALPAKVSKQTQMIVQQMFTSFFALRKKVEEGEYDKPVRLPKYLPKDGYFVIQYEKGALSFKEDGYVFLSQTSIKVKTNCLKESITMVRIVPMGNHFVIEVLYDIKKPEIDETDFSRVAFVDPGMNNLMTVTSNVFSPLLYNGRPAKAVNQLYNKNRALLQSKLPYQRQIYQNALDMVLTPYQMGKTRALQAVTSKRYFRIHDMFHKITTHLVNHLVLNDIKVLIFGHNVGQKQDINLGHKTNQNFVGLPFTKLMMMLQYKCERVGIQFISTEESHTSKCSFLDKETVEHHDHYVGCRIKRGLFKTASGIRINADINGSLNIGRKYMMANDLYTDDLHDQLVLFMHNPKRITISVC